MAKPTKVSVPPGFTSRADTAIKKALEKQFGNGKVEALLTEKLSKKQIPVIEQAAAEALRGYALAMHSNLKHGFVNEDVTSPMIDTGAGVAFSPGSNGTPRWAPLSAETKRRKQSIRRYRRVWAHHVDPDMRLVTALGPSLRRLAAMQPRLHKVWPRGKVVKIGGTSQLTLRYALAFPRGSAAGDPALFKIVMRNFVAGRWHMLEKGTSPSQSYRSARTGAGGGKRQAPQPGAVLYPEDMRPMLGPAAAIAGRVFRAKLRARLKS